MIQNKSPMLILRAADQTDVTISRAAASLSTVLQPSLDSDATTSGIVHVSVAAQALGHLCALAEKVAARVAPGGRADDPLAPLRVMPPQCQMDVARAAKKLEFSIIAQLAMVPITAMLRGRTAEVLRVVLSAPDDLTAEQKRVASEEPLFQPHDPDCDESELDEDDDDDDDAILAACLHDLDARSLRTLKSVSRAWQRRARRVLGEASSSWRQIPEWSAGAWAEAWFGERLSSHDETMRKRGLLALDALEAAVELPHFLSLIVRTLRYEPRSSHRALALRALSRVDALTLKVHADDLDAALSSLEPHESETTAAYTLRQKLAGARVNPVDADTSAAYMVALSAGGLSASLGKRAVNKRRRDEVTDTEASVATNGTKKEKVLAPDDLRRRLVSRWD